jgi:hypothetical protein
MAHTLTAEEKQLVDAALTTAALEASHHAQFYALSANDAATPADRVPEYLEKAQANEAHALKLFTLKAMLFTGTVEVTHQL